MDPRSRAIEAFRAHDFAKARQLYGKLASQGDSHAQYLMATMHSLGQGGPVNVNKAVELYREAAEAGHATAQYCLGALYAQGRGVPQDYTEALRWYRKAAEGGDADAYLKVGLIFANGQGVPTNFKEARRAWERAAEQRHGEAMLFLGRLFEHGDGCERDLPTAAHWYMKAWQVDNPEGTKSALALVPELDRLADKGSAAAQSILGVIHKYLTNDEPKAIRRLAQASGQGCAEATRLLGYCYQHGEGVERDMGRAASLYMEAAKSGDGVAQFNVGVFHERGLGGFTQDADEAIEWYRRAAEQGERDALQPLAKLLAKRNASRVDAAEAIQRLQMFAVDGPEDREYRLDGGTGEWSAVIRDRGQTVALRGISLDDLNLTTRDEVS